MTGAGGNKYNDIHLFLILFRQDSGRLALLSGGFLYIFFPLTLLFPLFFFFLSFSLSHFLRMRLHLSPSSYQNLILSLFLTAVARVRESRIKPTAYNHNGITSISSRSATRNCASKSNRAMRGDRYILYRKMENISGIPMKIHQD